MANWILFNSTATKPAPVAVNLDMVKLMIAGTAPNTVSLDGVLVSGNVANILLMVNHVTYPGAVSSPITAA